MEATNALLDKFLNQVSWGDELQRVDGYLINDNRVLIPVPNNDDLCHVNDNFLQWMTSQHKDFEGFDYILGEWDEPDEFIIEFSFSCLENEVWPYWTDARNQVVFDGWLSGILNQTGIRWWDPNVWSLENTYSKS